MMKALLLGFTLTGCSAAQMAGASVITKREFEVNNKSKEAVCSVDIVNDKNLDRGGDTRSANVDVKPGEQKVVTLDVAKDQDRTLRFKTCKGAVLKSQAFPYAPTRARVDLE